MTLGVPTSTDSPTLGPSIPIPGRGIIEPADAREQPFQGVTLDLAGGVVDDLAIQTREPFRSRAHDVFVVGDAKNVRAAEGVRPARSPDWRRASARSAWARWEPARRPLPRSRSPKQLVAPTVTSAVTDANNLCISCYRPSTSRLSVHPTLLRKPGRTQASNRVNWSCRYCSTHAARRILPLVVVGIDPGRYQNEIPDVQAVRLGYRGGDIALDLGEPAHRVPDRLRSVRFLSSMTVTRFSVLFTGTDIAATRPRVISWTVASMSSGW